MRLDVSAIVTGLHRNARVIAAQVEGVDERQACWRPSTGEWSILEVVNHLGDEEVLDFRTRVDLTLHQPGAEWPPIDPPAWAVERRYNERDLVESIARFLRERDASLAWLASLEAPDWTRTHEHPRLGTLSAGDLLTSWAAHDLIHVRQIDRLHRQYLLADLSAGSADYAGRW